MNVFEGSLVCRIAGKTVPWIVRASRSSLTGKFFLAATASVGRAFSDSLVFRGLSKPVPLAGPERPMCTRLVFRIADRVRTTVGWAERPVTAAWTVAARDSSFARGAWVTVVGASLVALGAALAAAGPASSGSRLLVSVGGLIVGAVLLLVGPRLLSGVKQSVVLGRSAHVARLLVEGPEVSTVAARPGIEPSARLGWRRFAGPLGAGVLLAAAAGAVAGAGGRPSASMAAAFAAGACLVLLVLWRPEAMLLAAAAFPWLDWAARRALGGLGSAWDDAFLLLFLALLIWCLLSRRHWELWSVPILLPALLAIVAATGSVVLRHVPADVATFALRLVFQPMLFYFLGFLLPKNKRWVQWTVAVFVLAGVALALHGIYQYVTHAPIPAQWVDVREVGIGTRAYSIIENPNGLGAFLLIGALVSGGLALSSGLSGRQRLTMAGACVIQLCGEAVTFSRGGWLGLVAGVLALLVMAYRRYLAPLVAAGVVGWFVMPRTMINRLTFAFSSTYIAQSLAFGRLYIWAYALRRIAAHPLFGVGLGTFGGTSAVKFRYSGLWVDNFYLQLAAEGGLILLFFFMWTLLAAARGLVQGYRRTADPYLKGLAAGAFGAVIAVGAANLTASIWETLVVSVGFWFMAGLATSACFQVSETDRQGNGS